MSIKRYEPVVRYVAKKGYVEDMEVALDGPYVLYTDHLAALRTEPCSTCCGTPHPSGKVCVCGGENTRDAEVNGLRLAVYEALQGAGWQGMEDELAQFVREMQAQLKRNAHRGDWKQGLTGTDFDEGVKRNLKDMRADGATPEQRSGAAVDLANFALMYWAAWMRHRPAPPKAIPSVMRVSGNVDESDPEMVAALDDLQAAAERHILRTKGAPCRACMALERGEVPQAASHTCKATPSPEEA